MSQYFYADTLLNRLNNEKDLPLLRSEYSVSSQNGENGILLEIIKRIFKFENKAIEDGTFFEFGASDGAETNMGFFVDWLDWEGIFIESDPELFFKLNRKYKYSTNIKCYSDFVTKHNVNNYITDNLDVLSIDVDGDDYYIWEAVEKQPKIVCVEYNSALPLGQKTIVKEGMIWGPPYTTGYGVSIEALQDLSIKKGYVLVHTNLTGVNSFFVLDKYSHLFPESVSPKIHGPNHGLVSYSHIEETDMSKFITLED